MPNKLRLMRILSYIYPVTAVREASAFNEDIRVKYRLGQPELWINGALQSGEGYFRLWNIAFEKLHVPLGLRKRKSILVLGIGGGSSIRLLRSLNEKARITAVDIDPTVISLSKTYFGMSGIPGLEIINRDADTFLSDVAGKRMHFDVVVVDVYHGYAVPPFVETAEFPGRLRNIITKNGVVVINYSPPGDSETKFRLMLDKTAKFFQSVFTVEVYSNRFICVSP